MYNVDALMLLNSFNSVRLVSLDYYHYSDWTVKASELNIEYKVLSSFVDSSLPFIVEYALVKVGSRLDFRNFLRILNNHKNVLSIDDIKPINSTYPRLILMIVRGDYADSTRFKAHILGGSEIGYSTSGGVEHWVFLFPSSKVINMFIGIISGNGEVSRVREEALDPEEVITAIVRSKVKVLLSSDEERLLRIAHEKGLFDAPRRTSVRQLAKELGVSESTLSRNLSKIIRRILNAIINDEYSSW
ncbi:helix-turn-helix domain-containing protein [Caldivirga sp. UBA161]|uniref:helix-turn-helix domain-containing protein n=1 Tax=Caldivirga sp. UBA161 TaxID=1915569 RepID=UPI0025BBB826|nr:helix-turn-helix domain-containing protein [Caldivirga sp. UBA161]